MVTIKKIAELCGVSRGTVDRVLNGRGKVKPETEKLVRQMASQLGYRPNPAGKALAARKHLPVVGVLLVSEGNPFFDEVIRGLTRAAENYRIYGLEVLWRSMKGYNVATQLALIAEMKDKINALIISPINDPVIAAAIDELVAEGIFVITVNNDVENCHRHAYVGSDYFNGGETVCALFELLIGPKASVGIVMGSHHILGHESRLEGFKERMKRLPGFKVLDVIENDDDEFCSYERTRELLQRFPEMNALFIIAGGVYGACRAVQATKRSKPLTVVAFDSVPSTVEMMKKGVLQAVIYQHPYRQGHQAMELVFEYLVNGIKPQHENYILKNEIKLLENL